MYICFRIQGLLVISNGETLKMARGVFIVFLMSAWAVGLEGLEVGGRGLNCLTCSTVSNKKCSNASEVIHTSRPCQPAETFCQVKRIEYMITEVNEDYIPWSLERECSAECKPFCVNMGTRTKVNYCTSCCTESHCNVDNSSTQQVPLLSLWVALFLLPWSNGPIFLGIS
ncbi:hypothetical protein TCAL_04321 [Tigriopus californicus]|uniref:Snake toxin/toxin-like domain-containing protein n=1 Tax=Tigriopus californicus TaxID=6832 RepID=A0A553PT20_TIGCA|nr:uncharacterized protein LOC131891820 [Tigriopus californicus]TRY80829.1 hypothetical protein TCAL_04321 [Tigriopus californicus]|eukprot:TCALIF_04321-PA protein Name:"Protein of unknown function" AED:0.29 eAED:0.29 QI:136/1/1/1/0/1/2/201/169